jgi:hypothetical protein
MVELDGVMVRGVRGVREVKTAPMPTRPDNGHISVTSYSELFNPLQNGPRMRILPQA